jgi:hypothetical protein
LIVATTVLKMEKSLIHLANEAAYQALPYYC